MTGVWKKVHVALVLLILSVTFMAASGGGVSPAGTGASSQTSGSTEQGTGSQGAGS